MFRKTLVTLLVAALLLTSLGTLAVAETARPLEGVELTIWRPWMWASALKSEDENLVWQTIEERLGVELTIITPTIGSEQEQFNLMMAGGELPDIIYTGWSGFDMYTGGLDKYVDEGVLIDFADLAAEYAPNYMYCIENFVPENEKKEFYTDSGYMCQFYAISPYEESCYNGLMFRQDFIDQLGVERPNTIAEVKDILSRMKNELGVQYPLIFPGNGIDTTGGVIVGAYGIGPAFYQENNVVKYGPIEEGFKAYLSEMAAWYAEGLIDVDFPARDEEAMKRMMTTGESGAIIHSPDTVGAWMTGITDMFASYYPTINEDETCQYRLKTYACRPPYCAGITTECDNVEAAMTFLDYGFTEEGWMLHNYGVEGDTYNMVDGVAVFTDKIVNNPDYPNMLDTIAMYKTHIGPFLRFEHESNPTVNAANQVNRMLWTETCGTELCMPYITMTSDEGTEYANIMSQINTYKDPIIVNCIMGNQSVDEAWDEYVATIKGLGIDRAIEIQQAALDRYNAR